VCNTQGAGHAGMLLRWVGRYVAGQGFLNIAKCTRTLWALNL